jgi:hypothetical protein
VPVALQEILGTSAVSGCWLCCSLCEGRLKRPAGWPGLCHPFLLSGPASCREVCALQEQAGCSKKQFIVLSLTWES